ncbi:hypothetical protein ALC62_04322, partial [Cyphomyrmex costatus]
GASSCRSVLRFDVGNHAPHSPSAAEIFGFIVCEGLSPNRARKTSRKEGEEGPTTSRTKKEDEEGEEEDRGRAWGERERILSGNGSSREKRRRGEGSVVNLIFKCKQIYIVAKAPPTDVVLLSTAADAEASSPTCWIFFFIFFSIIKDCY